MMTLDELIPELINTDPKQTEVISHQITQLKEKALVSPEYRYVIEGFIGYLLLQIEGENNLEAKTYLDQYFKEAKRYTEAFKYRVNPTGRVMTNIERFTHLQLCGMLLEAMKRHDSNFSAYHNNIEMLETDIASISRVSSWLSRLGSKTQQSKKFQKKTVIIIIAIDFIILAAGLIIFFVIR